MKRRRIPRYPAGPFEAVYYPNGPDGVAVSMGRNLSEAEADRRAREHYAAHGNNTAIVKCVPIPLDFPRYEVTKRYEAQS